MIPRFAGMGLGDPRGEINLLFIIFFSSLSRMSSGHHHQAERTGLSKSKSHLARQNFGSYSPLFLLPTFAFTNLESTYYLVGEFVLQNQ
ncbi:MAG: hypothetical protein R2688_01230 [Fimbriimonadaceae bacterium]